MLQAHFRAVASREGFCKLPLGLGVIGQIANLPKDKGLDVLATQFGAKFMDSQVDEGLGVLPMRKDAIDSFSSLTCKRCFVRVMFSSKFNGLALDRIIQHSFIMKDEWSVWWADAILPMTYAGFPDTVDFQTLVQCSPYPSESHVPFRYGWWDPFKLHFGCFEIGVVFPHDPGKRPRPSGYVHHISPVSS